MVGLKEISGLVACHVHTNPFMPPPPSKLRSAAASAENNDSAAATGLRSRPVVCLAPLLSLLPSSQPKSYQTLACMLIPIKQLTLSSVVFFLSLAQPSLLFAC